MAHRLCVNFRVPSSNLLLVLFTFALLCSWYSTAQTPSTGAITGVVFDPSGATLPGVSVRIERIGVEKRRGTAIKSAVSSQAGRFAFFFLPPGEYEFKATKTGFHPFTIEPLRIVVTETVSLQVRLGLPLRVETTQVYSDSQPVQIDTAGLGRAVGGNVATALPLITRNFSQITTLSPGISAAVYNAGELGTGATAQSQLGKSNDGIYSHGARSYDNNWQLDGISVNDVFGTGPTSGGIPIPNPDSLAEFKVQTGLYDAAFGRGPGANVTVISKQGGDEFHGSLFEFLRNDVLNANDFFLKRTGQRRHALKQNQFGVALGGPIMKDKLFIFGSYQGTRQRNGLAAGQARIACSASLTQPALTNDRSPSALGRLFGGMHGELGGIAVAPDGSNINPVALGLLNFKLPDGSFLIPTPQTVDLSKPVSSQGFSVISQPCTFDEDQFLTNVDFLQSQKSQWAARFFTAGDDQSVSYVGNGFVPVGNISGFRSPGSSDYLVFSLSHTYAINANLLNEVQFGFVRTSTTTRASSPFRWSDIGVSEGEMNSNNELPSLFIAGSVAMTSAIPRTYSQKSFVLSENLSHLHGKHSLRLGGSMTRLHLNTDFSGAATALRFLSWPDFLLGLDATANGTGTFSNVFASSDIFGLLSRNYRAWEGSAFIQDDYKVARSLTLNLGLRYERIGQFGDELGRNSSFDVRNANVNPPATGSLDGYLAASNFSGPLPAGVARAENTFATYGRNQNVIAPRLGLAWQPLPWTNRFVVRAGYGLYPSRPPAQAAIQSILGAPFGLTRISTGTSNATATFQTPFAQPFPTSSSFPVFPAYSPTTNSVITAIAPDFRPALVQQFSLNAQAEMSNGWVLDVGYFGARGTHLQRLRSLNQALDASAQHPVRGETTNTLANVDQRVPVPGIGADSLRMLESAGSSWYKGLEASLAKRLSNGLQFLASYTFSKTLDTDGADINSTSTGNALTLGDQNSPRQRWGRASFDRTHRFVFSTTWTLPSPSLGWRRAILGNFSLAAIATIQSGSALTIADTNSTNVFGISGDRAQLSGTCSKGQLVNGGSVHSKLNGYFNTSCFTDPPIIGADGVGTAFGNSATGVVSGPAQANLDIALSKTIPLKWPVDTGNLQFRAEFYNALNHPQFANPDTNFTSATFGVITSTAVNPRVGQLALKFAF